MFAINRYIFVDKKKRVKFEIFARHVEFANSLVERVNKLGEYKLKPKRFFFSKRVYTQYPPYELEMSQQDYVEEMEAKHHGKN